MTFLLSSNSALFAEDALLNNFSSPHRFSCFVVGVGVIEPFGLGLLLPINEDILKFESNFFLNNS